jgi:uncharacterized protein
MGHFVGRTRELIELKEEYDSDHASLVVVSGRRRIGKTALIEHFSEKRRFYKFTGLAPSRGMRAQDQRHAFCQNLEAFFHLYGLRSDDWSSLFLVLAKQVQDKSVVILFDEISWMAHQDPTFLSKLKNAWDDYFSKNKRLMLVLCGSVSSWIEENIMRNTGYLGRPTWSLRLEELPLNQCNAFWGSGYKNITSFEKLKVLAVTGGVPRYLELMNPSVTAEANIQRLCFNNHAPLYKEFEYIFSDIYGKKTDAYQSIVYALRSGSLSRGEIALSAGLADSGVLTAYLKDLELGGFIKRSPTWSLKTGKVSKLSRYRLKDNYTRFYLKYILPNKNNIEEGLFSDAPLANLRGWNSMIGLQFENLVCNNMLLLLESIGIAYQDVVFANPYFQRKTARQDALQIDYLIQVKQDTVYLCEVKFRRSTIDTSVIKEVQDKARRLALPKHTSIRFVLVHVNGITDALEDACFFQSVIDFSDFLG